MKNLIPLVLAFLTLTLTACNKDDLPITTETTTEKTEPSTITETTTSPPKTTSGRTESSAPTAEPEPTTEITEEPPELPETTIETTTTVTTTVATTTLPETTTVTTTTTVTEPPVIDFEREVFRLFNVERAANGIPPLEWHDELAAVARTHSHDMWIREFFSHTCPSGLDSQDRIENAGLQFGIQWGSNENIATGSSPEDVVNRWMNSTGHRNAILNPQHIYVGVGQSWGLWTANFIFVMRA
ncbi:MAG: CAP domain-containing protein [Oscillospiraceae bacterium]|nr:CAP domain-containing protein [Oscillospiraceae bacterium]